MGVELKWKRTFKLNWPNGQIFPSLGNNFSNNNQPINQKERKFSMQGKKPLSNFAKHAVKVMTAGKKKMTVLKNGGREAITEYRILKDLLYLAYLEIRLKTGRTHQIRVHLSSIGKPIFGDPTYGGKQIMYGSEFPKIKSRVQNLLNIMPRQALHAKTLGFFHPHLKKMVNFNSDLPEDMELLINNLKSTSS